MISIPVAVHKDFFKWQLNLFWHNQKKIYKNDCMDKTFAVIIKRNHPQETKVEAMNWDMDVPHMMCESFFDYISPELNPKNVPLNIQVGLKQVINKFEDDQILEVLDCDMVHIKTHPEINIKDDQLIVNDLYESWHLHSLSKNKHVVDIYFKNEGQFYNGGFVPIIGNVKTFKKILPEWIDVHIDISKRFLGKSDSIHWWAGMFALQAACEKNKVTMIAKDWCYFPGINKISENHYIAHYSCSKIFDKKLYPNIDIAKFENNIFFNQVKDWLKL